MIENPNKLTEKNVLFFAFFLFFVRIRKILVEILPSRYVRVE